ncbi:hypothetical protein [Paractinoplanes atraurantiacus]|uniref:Uncharacterized protein n=1 Tax=Paractinoplanes atraurantiacus TaxID=1036182 RepID=A0A285GLD2_9ACTN|nr:hypothetical protein [Actinoplanes atraurantiacus]SNY24004.1 hypothetical protein SAMN05421748_102124 [Actinoplanes atraurantiacus]
MSRVFGIELRRSAAIGSALALAVVGTLLLVLDAGAGFGDGWMQLAMTQRLYLAVLWPLALAAGAWQGRREHRTRVGELFASTPRPVAQRVLPTLGAMAVAVVAGYLVMGAAGGIWIARTAEYFPVQVFAVTAVGVLALIAAAWLGLAVGRLLPWLPVAPALGVAGLGLLLTIPAATRPRGWLALVFSPIYEMNMPGSYADVPTRVSAAQAAWLAALAAAAVLLSTSAGWRARTAALLPVAVGAAVAIAVMPHQNRTVTDAIDPVAKELVCAGGTPRVCVARVHSGRIDDLAGPAREGLKVLATLPGAPAEVHENTATYRPEWYPEFRADVVLVSVGFDTDLFEEVVTGAFDGPPTCENVPAPAERLAAAHWLMGRQPVADQTRDGYAAEYYAEAVQLWQGLQRLPRAEAQARVLALRKAAVTCTAAEGLLAGGKG